MNYIPILAQAAETATQASQQAEIVPVELIWQKITSLNLLESLTFTSFGVVCLFYGWRVFKILVTISFGLVGILAGTQLNNLLVGGNGIWLAVIFMALFALLSVPLMRWGVSALGAVAGGILTGGAWFALPLPEKFIWAGALVGVIAGGMISFIIFKAAIMLFTTLAGSLLVITAALGIAYHYMQMSQQLHDLVFYHQWFMPAIILAPMTAGLLVQYKLIKKTTEWKV